MGGGYRRLLGWRWWLSGRILKGAGVVLMRKGYLARWGLGDMVGTRVIWGSIHGTGNKDYKGVFGGPYIRNVTPIVSVMFTLNNGINLKPLLPPLPQRSPGLNRSH